MKLILIFTFFLGCFSLFAEEFVIFEDGSPRAKIIYAKSATSEVINQAEDLGKMLSRMTTCDFSTGNEGGKGIVIGTAADYPEFVGDLPKTVKSFDDIEHYRIKSTSEALYLIGSDEKGVKNAVWDLLNRLGYRHFMPGKNWEIIPVSKKLTINIDITESPNYKLRRIWPFVLGMDAEYRKPYNAWEIHNRMGGTLVESHHTYTQIYNRNKVFFEKNPDCLALVNRIRKNDSLESIKFCPSNPKLQKLIEADAKQRADEQKGWGISMEPSDGLNWCECENCIKEFGSPSDQAVFLANLAVKAIQRIDQNMYVGVLGYSGHSLPPKKIKPDERIVISTTAGFLFYGLTTEGTIAGWEKAGIKYSGVYEYACVAPWSWFMPDKTRFADLKYIKDKIPEYYQLGVRFFDAESGGASGPLGLSSYLLSKYLWNVANVKNEKEYIKDFCEKSFGQAAEVMHEYVKLTDGANKILICEDWFKRVYSVLNKAYKLEKDPQVVNRLDDLAIYIRYCELFYNYTSNNTDSRQTSFQKCMTHVYRQKERMMLCLPAFMYMSPAFTDSRVKFPAEQNSFPAAWVSTEPFTKEEINSWINYAQTNYVLIDFTPVSYSNDLKPATPLQLTSKINTESAFGLMTQEPYVVRIWKDQPQGDIKVQASHGLIQHYRSFASKAMIKLYADNENFQGRALDEAILPLNGVTQNLKLKSPHAGLHSIAVENNFGGTIVKWDSDVKAVREASSLKSMEVNGTLTGYFYVPINTQVIGGYFSGGALQVFDSNGLLIYTQPENKSQFFSIKVPEGQANKAWKIFLANGKLKLMTVPPYIAPTPQQLLVPSEILSKKAIK